MWKLNDILPNNRQVKEEIFRDIRKLFEMYVHENIVHHNLWDAANAKAVFREKFIAVHVCTRKEGDIMSEI